MGMESGDIVLGAAPRDVTEVAHACWRAANYRFAPPGWYQATPPGPLTFRIISHAQRAEQLAAEDMIEFGAEDATS